MTREAESEGKEYLHARLARVDPVTARRLHPNDVRRVVRALEVWELTGQPISSWQNPWTAHSPTGFSTSSEPRNPFTSFQAGSRPYQLTRPLVNSISGAPFL